MAGYHTLESNANLRCIAAAAGIAAIAQAVGAGVMPASWQEGRRLLSLITGLGLACAILFSGFCTYERLGLVRDARAAQARTANGPYKQAQDALKEAIEDAEKECASGIGPRCRELKAERDAKRAALAATPSPRAESLLGDLEIIPQLAFPLMLQIFGFAFMAYAGTHSRCQAPGARCQEGQMQGTAHPTTSAPVVLAAPQRPANWDAAKADLLAILGAGGQIPEQKLLARRWGVGESCVSKWLSKIERDGAIERRRAGKARGVRAA